MTNGKDPSDRKWIDDAEAALNRTAEALRSAWEETRDARMSTLESAKEAAERLGEAIDQGIAAAKEAWDPSRKESRTHGSVSEPAPADGQEEE